MNIWEKRADESQIQYRAFRCYLEKRSIEAAFKEYDKNKKAQKGAKSPHRSSGSFRQWSKLFDWKERCEAYDNYLHAKTIEATAKARSAAYEERQRLYHGMANRIHKAIAKAVDEGKNLRVGELIDAVKYYDSEFQAQMERENLRELRETMQ